MRLFLDSSVLLAAAGSASGASRLLIKIAPAKGWELCTSDYCLRETEHNLVKLGQEAAEAWRQIVRPSLNLSPVRLVLDRPFIYRVTKDRPVVISSLSLKANFLLTLDRGDFHDLLGRSVYGLPIRTPGEFLKEIRRQES